MPQATPEFRPLTISGVVTSVKWSPQGSLLAVMTSDSLYLCTADDFRTYPILSSEIRDYSWSENGQWLLYAKHTGSINTLERIGPVPEVVDGTIVDLTPQPIKITGLPPPLETLRFYNPIYILEDTRIAFAVDRMAATQGVWTIPAEGGEARLCIEAAYIPWFLDWDREHQRILFSKRDLPYICGMRVTSQGLSAGEVVSLELSERPASFDLHAASGKIALSTSTNWTFYIWRTSLTEDLSDREFEPFITRYLQTFTPAVSSNQDRLYFSAVIPEEGLKLKAYNFANDEISDLHPINPLYSNEYIPTPDPVTDRYIAFKALRNNLEGLHYYDTSLGTIGTLLTMQDRGTTVQHPSWSADGNSIYYTLISRDGSAPNTISRLSLRRTSGGIIPLSSEPILTDQNVFSPYTDAAEKMLLYRIVQENDNELWVLELSTGDRKRLARGRSPVLDSSRQDVYYFSDDRLMRIKNWPGIFEKQLIEDIVSVLPGSVSSRGIRCIAVGDDAVYAVLHQESVGSIKVGRLHLPSGRD
jgi:WD40 repeat protein